MTSGILGNLWKCNFRIAKTTSEAEKYFDLSIDYKGDYIYIVATYQFCGDLKKSIEAMSPQNIKAGGIGLRSMRNMAEVYGGYFEAADVDNKFCVG